MKRGQNYCVMCGAASPPDFRALSDPLLGKVLADRYELKEVLGAGSMGVVYRADHLTLGTDVAVKVLRRRLVSDDTMIRRFKTEARAAARLHHPNTIQIFDFGEIGSKELFIVMEFVEGQDLSSLISQEGPLAPTRLVDILLQVCSALVEAHHHGIVHRDLKPANILVSNLRTRRDLVTVLDFGIAKILNPDSSESVPVTREGFVCGTPAFMSPEQVQGYEIDGRSDLFSLGVCMYQALTGKLPFFAPSPLDLATALITQEAKPPTLVRPDWSPHPLLEALCLKALQKNPEDRFASAEELGQALEALRDLPSTAWDHTENTSPFDRATAMDDEGDTSLDNITTQPLAPTRRPKPHLRRLLAAAAALIGFLVATTGMQWCAQGPGGAVHVKGD